MVIQPIVDIATVCALHGIRQAVICPGSRSALITIAFARHPDIATFVIPDERSAGFVALGLAQSSGHTVAVICTSGTAAANLYPAIIEAHYQEVPLLIITADRPPELIGQQDGQTIRQYNLYANHIRGFFQFPASFGSEAESLHAVRLVNEALLCTRGMVKGPVQLNVPVREPFYPAPDEELKFNQNLKIIINTYPALTKPDLELLIREVSDYQKIMILVGQQRYDEKLIPLLQKIQRQSYCVLVGELFSNIHTLPGVIIHHDLILTNGHSELKPDLLITCGQGVLSKNLKKFLRQNPPKAHWHIGKNPDVVDTYHALTRKIIANPVDFFHAFAEWHQPDNSASEGFLRLWQEKSRKANQLVDDFISESVHGEFAAVGIIMNHIPAGSTLHLANSMPVRYAAMAGLRSDVHVWSNRGASGIDGCTGTAVGHAINSTGLHILITGDMAFFYDRNSLWHDHVPANLRIIVLNNHGGGIFRLIDGPGKLPELEKYFETRQPLNAENTARDFGMAYFFNDDNEALETQLQQFLLPETGAAILEIETSATVNEEEFVRFKQRLQQF